jgi:hypothetical protein
MSQSTPPSARLQAELENRILHGIACEWENALWVLSPEMRDKMYKPLFSLRTMKSRHGFWDRDMKEIALSRNLVNNYPWSVVRDVLRHEMAHQYADCILKAGNEKPHGPKFHKACHLLRANPQSSRYYRSFSAGYAPEVETENDKMLRRIKKLMALSTSCNRHEAEAAMAKAHVLIAKYNLDVIHHDRCRNFQSIFLGQPLLRQKREVYHLSHLLQSFYFVHAIWVSAYVLDKGKMGRVLELSGSPENLQIAGYVYDFVLNFILQQWHKYNFKNKLNRYRQTDFAVGIIEGFSAKLKISKIKSSTPQADKALVAINDPALIKYARYRYPHTTNFRRGGSSQDGRVLNDGIEVGRKLVIHKGISRRELNKKRLLIE